ncbi:ATP-grasp domain-containing protein [Streptomyces tunisiensis]|uniref:hypothetical protein n=1 Tax=Streptomyces tunisiensis TaxID=948699 RepID=UPI00398A3168
MGDGSLPAHHVRRPPGRTLSTYTTTKRCSRRQVFACELERLPPDALDVVVTDTFDVEGLTDRLRRTPRLRGLISSTDTWTLAGAELADRLGLPGLDPAVLRLTRDKAAVRNRLHDAGVTRGRALEANGVFTGVAGLDRLADMPGSPAWYRSGPSATPSSRPARSSPGPAAASTGTPCGCPAPPCSWASRWARRDHGGGR